MGTAGRKLSYLEHDQPAWLEVAEVQWGYGRVTVNSGDSLLFEFVLSKGECGRTCVCINVCVCGGGGGWLRRRAAACCLSLLSMPPHPCTVCRRHGERLGEALQQPRPQACVQAFRPHPPHDWGELC
jgi:hypothetical protein